MPCPTPHFAQDTLRLAATSKSEWQHPLGRMLACESPMQPGQSEHPKVPYKTCFHTNRPDRDLTTFVEAFFSCKTSVIPFSCVFGKTNTKALIADYLLRRLAKRSVHCKALLPTHARTPTPLCLRSGTARTPVPRPLPCAQRVRGRATAQRRAMAAWQQTRLWAGLPGA